MRERKNNKRFEWEIDSYNQIDVELLSVQLHSLYKKRNLNFNTDLYAQEIKESDSELNIKSSDAIDLAVRSFCLAFQKTLQNHGIITKNISKDNIGSYGKYHLSAVNWVLAETKFSFLSALKGRMNKEGIIENLENHLRNDISDEKRMEIEQTIQNIKESSKLNLGERLMFLFATPMTMVGFIENEDVCLTVGNAVKKTKENLIKWEQSIIGNALRQLHFESDNATE